MTAEHRENPPPSKKKKPYRIPQLTRHGKLVDLTTGGTGQAKETSGGQSSKRPTG